MFISLSTVFDGNCNHLVCTRDVSDITLTCTHIEKLKCMQTPDRQYYAIVTVIIEMSSSLLYNIVCP